MFEIIYDLKPEQVNLITIIPVGIEKPYLPKIEKPYGQLITNYLQNFKNTYSTQIYHYPVLTQEFGILFVKCVDSNGLVNLNTLFNNLFLTLEDSAFVWWYTYVLNYNSLKLSSNDIEYQEYLFDQQLSKLNNSGQILLTNVQSPIYQM